MYDNYYFLKPLSRAIAESLGVPWQLGQEGEALPPNQDNPMELVTCFSQDKDELILGFCHDKADFYIRAVLSAELGLLNFPENFARAKRNSVDLFSEVKFVAIEKVIQYLNERSFSIQFAEGYSLLFKMHGRRSNIILFQADNFVFGFHKRMENDQHLELSAVDRPIDQTYEAFEQANYQWKNLFPTFGKEIRNYLESQNLAEQSPEAQWGILQEVLDWLDIPMYYILETDKGPQFTLLPPFTWPVSATERAQFTQAIAAINEFYYAYHRITLLQREKMEVTKVLEKKRKQGQNYINKNLRKLTDLKENTNNEENANLIMANLHQIPAGATSVELFDFYNNGTRKIKLKKDLSPQKNAESYYRKAKNEKIEIESLEKNIERKEKELAEIQDYLTQIEAIEQVKELRKYLKKHHLSPGQASQKPDQLPFKNFSYQGFTIWVGKNSKNNDLLTQQYAHKDDLWLHAKDVSGSHVVIRHQSGKPFPTDVIEKAAALAAYYSKRSSDSLCPVIYTPKKFVRKTKDLAPGQVIVEKEEVIMVVPEKFE